MTFASTPYKLSNLVILFAWIGVFVGISIATQRQVLADTVAWYMPHEAIRSYQEYEGNKFFTVQNVRELQYAYADNRTVNMENLPESTTIISPGERERKTISIPSISNGYTHKKVGDITITTEPAVPQVEYFGESPSDNAQVQVEELIEVSINSLVANETESMRNIFGDFSEEILISDNVNAEEIALSGVQWRTGNIILQSDAAHIGYAQISMGKCEQTVYLPIEFDIQSQAYTLQDYAEFIENLCPATGILGFTFGELCEDCTYYPVDRYTPLPNTGYDPGDIVYVAEVPGGQYISRRAYDDLVALYQAAFSAGYSMYLTSGYRSYWIQANTYESWVQYEISRGNNRTTAEAIAAQYSARPGFSEHQLGTTVDIGAQSCSAFAAGCNGTLWDWLAMNAYQYGFIMSYPPGSQAKTGYVHEPWHYRWVGREYAAEYNQVKDEYVLSEWLKLKNDGKI